MAPNRCVTPPAIISTGIHKEQMVLRRLHPVQRKARWVFALEDFRLWHAPQACV